MCPYGRDIVSKCLDFVELCPVLVGLVSTLLWDNRKLLEMGIGSAPERNRTLSQGRYELPYMPYGPRKG